MDATTMQLIAKATDNNMTFMSQIQRSISINGIYEDAFPIRVHTLQHKNVQKFWACATVQRYE